MSLHTYAPPLPPGRPTAARRRCGVRIPTHSRRSPGSWRLASPSQRDEDSRPLSPSRLWRGPRAPPPEAAAAGGPGPSPRPCGRPGSLPCEEASPSGP
eukprot:scaffold1206_cov388-Prasinococcus_capsulatus_cf.AAC.52